MASNRSWAAVQTKAHIWKKLVCLHLRACSRDPGSPALNTSTDQLWKQQNTANISSSFKGIWKEIQLTTRVDTQHFLTFHLSSLVCLLSSSFPRSSHSLFVSFACRFLMPVPYCLLLLQFSSRQLLFIPQTLSARVLPVLSLFLHGSFMGTKVPGTSYKAQHPSGTRRGIQFYVSNNLSDMQRRHKHEVHFSRKPIAFSPTVCELFPIVPTSIAKGKVSPGLCLLKTFVKRCISQVRDNQDGL